MAGDTQKTQFQPEIENLKKIDTQKKKTLFSPFLNEAVSGDVNDSSTRQC